MKVLIAALLAGASMAPAQAPKKQTFIGTISDDMCALTGHAAMRMGPTDADCTRACVSAHGASYVLADGKNVYVLSDQKAPERFAAMKVKVVGRLNTTTKTIQVESIVAEK